MNIPEKIKIGGLTYTVEITDRLDLGVAHCSAEILYNDLIIRVTPQAKEKMEADFWHEVVHGILSMLGYKQHEEKRVEEFAQALYMVLQDNPEMLAPGKTGKHEG